MRHSLPLLFLVATVGCAGALIIEDPDPTDNSAGGAGGGAGAGGAGGCSGADCLPDGPLCSVDEPDGVCPEPLDCEGGVCTSVGAGFCDCEPGQGWTADAECVEISSINRCSAINPSGLCPGCDACVQGSCIPCSTAQACTEDNTDGCCPATAACSPLGLCVTIVDDACGPANLNGFCAQGEKCTEGECVLVRCGPDPGEELGFCSDADEKCVDGECLPVCPDGEFVSAGGGCIPNGTCGAAADCSFGFFCASDGLCAELGTCSIEAPECPDFHTCEVPQCVRDYTCTGQDDCPPEEYCGSQARCLLNGECEVTPDCGTGSFCAQALVCVADGRCADSRDCPVAGAVCSADGECIAEGACNTIADCPPGRTCVNSVCTVPVGDECTADLTSQGCTPDEVTCCPGGEMCCDLGERCAADGGCVEVGECTVTADCNSGFTCINYVCVPDVVCTDDIDCPGESCSFLGGCIADECGSEFDCRSGFEVCSPDLTCEPDTTCGADRFYTTTLVEPNMLIVLDRSGSMAWSPSAPGGPAVSAPNRRWDVAVNALTQVVGDNQDKIRFGLITFSGNDVDNNADPDVFTGFVDPGASPSTSQQTIVDALSPLGPGGNTPTGMMLRLIASDTEHFGLPDPADPVTRTNYILLVTDGDPTRAGDTFGVCDNIDSGVNEAEDGYEEVLCGMDYLRNPPVAVPPDPSISTFMVGFSGGTPANNNCFATHGGTSLCGSPAQCTGIGADQTACQSVDGCTWSGTTCEDGIDTTNCRTGANTCYYDASDATSLSAAFADIAAQVASCSYTIDDNPPDIGRLSVYVDMADNSGLVWVDQDLGHADGWDLDTNVSPARVNFYGPACDTLQNGLANPIVVYGCCFGEGC